MNQAYITVTAMHRYCGTEFLKDEKGTQVLLEKEPDNKYDTEAIKVKLPGVGTIGYVANSVHTVCEDCMSAGRLYDKIPDTAKATILYILPNALICTVDYEKE